MSKNILSMSPLGFPWRTQDPFLFCAYHLDDYPEGNEQMTVSAEARQGRQMGQDFEIRDGWRMYHGMRVPGFPYHPHRGFETITINKQGVVDHTDSLGAAGRFMEGDVQWMTAGKGVQHSEMFPLLYQHKKNTLEIFQIWLNLPARSKFVEPHFKMLWREQIPQLILKSEQGETKIDIIAGKLHGIDALEPTPNSWASDPAHGVGVFTIEMTPGAEATLPAAIPGAHRTIYFYDGDLIAVDGEPVSTFHHLDLLATSDIKLSNVGSSTARILVLDGVPIGEPVAKYGPFVMNTETEIQQAFADYRATEFGGWPWPSREVVHGREEGRFALYADGVKELPEG